jgi:DNA-binding MarR family transcriptional regulator
MSIAKFPKRRVRAAGARYVAPPTVSAPSLLRDGSDREFQRLIFDLFTISARIEQIRSHLASRTGISAPQYSLLRAVSLLQGETGVSIGIVAKHLHVTSAFITAQSRLLVELGFLKKKEAAADRRVSLLSLTPNGKRLVGEVVEQVRPINDMFFGILQKDEFETLCEIIEKLVDSSRNAIVHISSQNEEALLSSRDQRMSAADQ